jgi:phage anti-repressor protein
MDPTGFLTRERVSQIVTLAAASHNDFPIELTGEIDGTGHYYWEVLGFTEQRNAIRSLRDNFEEGIEFSSEMSENQSGGRGRPSQKIWVSIDTYKQMLMMSRTEVGKKTRVYFIEAEKELRRREVERETQPAIQNIAPAQEFIAALQVHEMCIKLLRDINMFDARTEMETAGMIKHLQQAVTFSASKKLPGVTLEDNPTLLPAPLPQFQRRSVNVDTPLTAIEMISSYLPEYSRAATKIDSDLGKVIRPLYSERHGKNPIQTNHYLAAEPRKALGLSILQPARNGGVFPVNVYMPKDWDLIVQGMLNTGLIPAPLAAELKQELQQFRED